MYIYAYIDMDVCACVCVTPSSTLGSHQDCGPKEAEKEDDTATQVVGTNIIVEHTRGTARRSRLSYCGSLNLPTGCATW